ncbi:MAG: bifunctional folylpolyglutamate synthase/dihydrofolate synthase [Alphaproteobacteria bacterium]
MPPNSLLTLERIEGGPLPGDPSAGDAVDPILQRLTQLHPKVIDLSLGRLTRLLGVLGNPHLASPPVIHVAGTNGKGSVCAYLVAMLRARGLRVHAYTSPHLVRFNERIALDGRHIDDDRLTALLEECEAANAGEAITFFEITTAAAFLAYARAPGDVLVLETGLGGRADATNVIPRPLATAITSISMDHMQFLGPTLAAIAAEKAAIQKPGVPSIVAPQEPAALAPIAAYAASVGAPLLRYGRDWSVAAETDCLLFSSAGEALRLPLPGLPGRHQVENAGVALATAAMLPPRLRPDADAMATGLRTVDWPARLQRLRRGPLVGLLPPGWELWLDGGHNAGAGQVIAAHAHGWRDRPLHLVFGMLDSKDPQAFLAPLARRAETLHAVAIPDEPASMTAEQAAAIAAETGLKAVAAGSVRAAVCRIVEASEGPARILICGSLYLAGKVLRDNG